MLTDSLSGVAKRLLDVVDRELREVLDHRPGGHALGDDGDHGCHRNARPADARNTTHDAMIDPYPLEGHALNARAGVLSTSSR